MFSKASPLFVSPQTTSLVRPALGLFRDYVPEGVHFLFDGGTIVFLLAILLITWRTIANTSITLTATTGTPGAGQFQIGTDPQRALDEVRG